ncbi:hypothetical protein GGR56DRAFT_675229 [Xylariaceae sp. FL0804]|nr:hypothetical protein GGR56DRAFT_675229 [Xylariaceae sp. FL0804]
MMFFSAPVTLVLLGACTTAVLSQGFIATCQPPNLFYEGGAWLLSTQCTKKGSQELKCSTLNLNLCYATDLVPTKDGDFSGSCGACQLSGDSNQYLDCACSGNDFKSMADLSDLIMNVNGYLQCFDKDHRAQNCANN